MYSLYQEYNNNTILLVLGIPDSGLTWISILYILDNNGEYIIISLPLRLAVMEVLAFPIELSLTTEKVHN